MSVSELVRWTALDFIPPLLHIVALLALSGRKRGSYTQLSALAGVLNVLVFAELGRTCLKVARGWVAGLLLALAPLHVWYSQEARMYVMIALWYYIVVAKRIEAWLEPTRWVLWVGYGLDTTAALYTHYYAVSGSCSLPVLSLSAHPPRLTNRLSGVGRGQGRCSPCFCRGCPLFCCPHRGGGGWVALGMGKPSVAGFGADGSALYGGHGAMLYPALIRRAAMPCSLLVSCGIVAAQKRHAA